MTHYHQRRRADPQRPRCAEEGCDHTSEARGLCKAHYGRQPDRVVAHREANLRWATKNPAEKEEARRAWVRANRASVNERERSRQRRWREANPGAASAKLAAWAAANPARWELYRRGNHQLRRARKRGAQMEPINLTRVLDQHGLICHICGGEIEMTDLHFDHVVPLARNGTHTYDNIRPAHAGCNLRKGCRVD